MISKSTMRQILNQLMAMKMLYAVWCQHPVEVEGLLRHEIDICKWGC